MLLELVETVAPHLSVRLEPCVQLDEGLATDAVEATLTIGAYTNQAGITQDTQVLRRRRLADGQSLDEGLNRLFTGAQLVEDEAPGRLGDYLNRGINRHGRKYAPLGIYLSRHIRRLTER